MKRTLFVSALILLSIFCISSQGYAATLAEKLQGKLLLQVEDKGRIWYVSPKDQKKHEVTFANALPLFEGQATGITNNDLNKIPINPDSLTQSLDTDGDGFSDYDEVKNGYNPYGDGKFIFNTSLANRMKGKLLLQVEDKGRIWYVDFDGKRWEITWNNLMNRFRNLSLGIKNVDLNKITSTQIVVTPPSSTPTPTPTTTPSSEVTCYSAHSAQNPMNTRSFALLGNDRYTDYCSDSSTKVQYGCNGNALTTTEFSCAFGCSSGACNTQPPIQVTTPSTTCQAYTSLNSSKREYVTLNNNEFYNDYCVNSDIVSQYSCKDNYLQQTQTRCTNGCSNGACNIAQNAEPQSEQYSCTLSAQANNIYTEEYVTINGNEYYYDFCANTSTAAEYYCNGTTLAKKESTCEFGCSNGVCNKYPQLPSETYSCNSNGTLQNQYQRESIFVNNNVEYKDYCTSDTNIAQFSCDGTKAEIRYSYCPEGCVNGACNSIKNQHNGAECKPENCSSINWRTRAQQLPIPNYSTSFDSKGRFVLKSGTQFEVWMPDNSYNAEEYGRISLYQLIKAYNNTKDILGHEPIVRPDRIIQEYVIGSANTGGCCNYENGIPIFQWRLGNNREEYLKQISYNDPIYINLRDMDWSKMVGNHELLHRFLLDLGVSTFFNEGLAQYVQDRKLYDGQQVADYQAEVCKQDGYYTGGKITKYDYLSCNNNIWHIYESGDCFWYRIEKLYGTTAFKKIMTNIFNQSERQSIMNQSFNSNSAYMYEEIKQSIIPVVGTQFWDDFKEFNMSRTADQNMSYSLESGLESQACTILSQ